MTKAEWDEWKLHPQTKAFFRALKNGPEKLKEEWARGAFMSDDAAQTQNHQQRAMGKLDAFDYLITLDFAEFQFLQRKDTQDE